MHSKFKTFKSSTKRGVYRGNTNPSAGGNFNRFRKNTGGRKMRTMSSNDPNIFIKKATFNVSAPLNSITHQSFNDFPIADILKENIKNKGYLKPTPIQDQSIEHMLDGRDLIGIANTGTGKTAAFLIPIINKIYKDRDSRAIILAPTRELATQIYQELQSFTRNIKIFSTLIIGGVNIRRQVSDLRAGQHIIVGTPGRIKDLIQQRVLYLEDYNMVVLDEVDLMVDIGFINDITYFISLLPKNRQSLFFSATINPKVNRVLESFVNNPVSVSVKVSDTPENVEQDVIKVISPEKKLDQLHDLLIKDGFNKVLVFGRTKHSVDKLYKSLVFRGFKVGAIHGNKKQGQRTRTLQSFKRNEIQILLATDVASRGLDIENVSHVINYELPESYNDYIHRIGRTGRADKKGTALTFVD